MTAEEKIMARSAKRLLWVVGAGGPPFEYVLPRLAERAEIYALVAIEISAVQRGLLSQWCADVATLDLAERSSSITEAIVQSAHRYEADGVVTFSEFAVIAVAEACQVLGLPGPGPNARFARDKWLMRQRWSEAGLPVPRFAKVENLHDLEVATRTLTLPILLKSSGRGGGIGQQVIDSTTSLPDALSNVDVALELAADHGIIEYSAGLNVRHCVAEEIIDSTTDSWYSDPRYGDFLSVEGIVANGVYHPICITARLPTLPPFAEIGAISPCVLREDLQRKIEELARASVDALGLDTCGTHTEFKLMSDERLCLLETAARPGGSTATALTEAVFGVDLLGLQASEALGLAQAYPERMLVGGAGAAASIYLFAADSTGRPWRSKTEFSWKELDWSKLVSAASRVTIIPTQMVPDGTVITPYHPGSGALNYAGSVLLYSPDPEILLNDSYRLIDGLEDTLLEQENSRKTSSRGR
jgi:biotin carboxylase